MQRTIGSAELVAYDSAISEIFHQASADHCLRNGIALPARGEIAFAEDPELGLRAVIAQRKDGKWFAGLLDTDAGKMVGGRVYPSRFKAEGYAKSLIPQTKLTTPAPIEEETIEPDVTEEQKAKAEVDDSPFAQKVLAHWEEFRPKMCRGLQKQDYLYQAVWAAAVNTLELMSELQHGRGGSTTRRRR